MVGYNVFTLQSPGLLHHVHLQIVASFSEESVVPPSAGSGRVKSLKIEMLFSYKISVATCQSE
jgi:hypothetical protein